jgi:hypothetical protein
MPRQAHYLQPLRSNRIPEHHIVFDCETAVRERAGKKAHYWTVGASCSISRETEGLFYPRRTELHHTPADLWHTIAGVQPPGRRLVAWAHNLSFDLRISEALRYLPELGYTLDAIVLERVASWASFTSEQGSLTLCDLYSWMPVPLDKLASDMGASRKKLNYALADRRELENRCKDDVYVTSMAVARMLGWLEEVGTGPFRPTGSGQSHSHFRRKYLGGKDILVHGDEYALERERTAMWTGRAEAWRHGEVKGPLYEHDLNLAYCRIAAACRVPVRLSHRQGGGMRVADINYSTRHTLMAEVTVTTDKPLVPTGEESRIYWPVGTFDTVLWEPELLLLTWEGAEAVVKRMWWYESDRVLKPMAEWLITELDKDTSQAPPPVGRLLKHWARTLVGRCGLRYREWEDFGEVPRLGLSLSTMYDVETGEEAELLHVGEKIMELAAMAEADTSVPQITGFVMSQARRQLWELVQVAGEENIAYMDTDCLIVNREGHERLEIGKLMPCCANLTHKATWASATIHGPRNIELEHERRISGVPVNAIRIGDTTFAAEVWAGVKASLSGSQLDHVAVTQRMFEVTQSDSRRVHLPDGSTRPHEVSNDPTD